MRRLVFLTALGLMLWSACAAAEVIFCNVASGEYRVTCDGEQTTVTVGADGTLSAECQSVSFVRMTGGGSVSCRERER